MADYWKEVDRPPLARGAATEEVLVPTNAKLARQMRVAAGWLWAYAGLTVVNLVLGAIHAPIRMIVGLISVELVVVIGRQLPMVAHVFSYLVAALAIGIVALVAFFTQRFAVWAFWTGIAVLVLDATVTYFFTTLAGVVPFLFHGIAVWFLVLGLKAARLHRSRRAAGQA